MAVPHTDFNRDVEASWKLFYIALRGVEGLKQRGLAKGR